MRVYSPGPPHHDVQEGMRRGTLLWHLSDVHPPVPQGNVQPLRAIQDMGRQPEMGSGSGEANAPWKIDILDFLEKNYMYEFSMEDLAHYTGRSLATFKRDFKKISDLTPEKWLIRKRLEAAYTLMREGGKKIGDVYLQVGFKNQSHFSNAFKKQYGIPPTAVGSFS